MNPPDYYGSKTNEDTQDFVDEVHNILCAMEFYEEAKAKFTSQLKDKALVWYTISADGRALGDVPITWDPSEDYFSGQILSQRATKSQG